MNLPSRRNTCENAVNKEPISTVAAKNKPEPKTPVISYDYEAAISQPDIPIYSNTENNMQNVSWSDSSDEQSASTKRRNLCVSGKVGVTTKKKIIFKSKTAKKVTKIHPPICDVEIKKESIPSSEIVRNVENCGKENNKGVITNRQKPPNLHQVCSNKIFPLDLLI